MKCMLLQKWFRIPSDPELENQINDRISFRKFLGLTLDTPSPDHSTFSRFRKRVSKNAMIELNSLVLNEFAKRGLVINEGIAVDARLVRSASKPLSNTEIEALRQKRNSPEGKLDENGNPLKFCRDAESNWVIKSEKQHYGLKEHASVDVDNGFILATTLTPRLGKRFSIPLGKQGRLRRNGGYICLGRLALLHYRNHISLLISGIMIRMQ